ncbi:hypothetical protein CC1G_12035 [Coprinopsis cinerea okayama7|uniref:Uncharacterized protein n=1 Tax=Coprinopsis cinerea (strain Okayama-7 / 130 / ATCC MYA-4618 / FGSC 9003) TaxID=240176 RepID=A8P8H8_COPC7|nr:hypothetical protein CC1G_12035 [Coprinopsis cinerea okayama7\|eukprot:XP_001839572.1 hypothetical protein CC1G_12035 [Coprinopsis cinerea okayama7\
MSRRPHPPSPSSPPLFVLLSALSLLILQQAWGAEAAFTMPVFSGNDTVDLNAAGTWCYYPGSFSSSSSSSSSSSTTTTITSNTSDGNPNPNSNANAQVDAELPPDVDSTCPPGTPKADLLAVLQRHLNQPPDDSLSIAYYSASLERLGGAGYPLGWAIGSNSNSNSGSGSPDPDSPTDDLSSIVGRKVYLCLSGQREDGTYKTICEVARGDNQFGLLDERGFEREREREGEGGEQKAVCALAVGQRHVSDGCYVPVGMSVEDDESGARGVTAGRGMSYAL